MTTNEAKDMKEVKQKRYRWQIGSTIILLLAAFVLTIIKLQPSINKPSGKFTAPEIAVAAQTTTQGDFPVYLTGLGTVTALRTVTVRTRVDGELVRVLFKEGQMVHKGDLLAEIDPRAVQAQLMQAEGQLLRDEALLKNAEIDLARYKTLLAQDSIAAQQTVTQESLVKQYKGTVEIDRGLVANTKLQLSYTQITAPISGRLGLRLIDQGNMVHASDVNGLVVITQIQPITVEFSLPEDTIPLVMKQFRTTQDLSIEAFDRSAQNKLAHGKLLAIDNQIDTSTGTIKLKGQFGNEDGALFSNQFVNIKMKVNTLPSVMIAPVAAIQRGILGTFVYVVKKDQTVSVKQVTIGPVDGEKVAVLNGLEANELIVVDGADKLRENSKVKVISSAPPPSLSEVSSQRAK